MKEIHQPWKVRLDGVDHFYWIGEVLDGPVDVLHLLCNDQIINDRLDSIAFVYRDHSLVSSSMGLGGVRNYDETEALYPVVDEINLCPDCFRVELMQRLSE